MVAITAIRAANARLLPEKSPTAVFVGATSGIGLATLTALLKSTTAPKIYIVGRSEATFAPALQDLHRLNPAATLTFIEAQVSLLRQVNRVCDLITAAQGPSALDLLWLSQGGMSMAGHQLTPEGLNADFAITYYSRTLFMHKLLPLLSRSADPRVLSVLSAGAEGSVVMDDMGMAKAENYGFVGALKQGVTLMSLGMRALAMSNPGVSFIHSNPGPVKTDVHRKMMDTMGDSVAMRAFGFVLNWVIFPLQDRFLAWSAEEAGDMGAFELTNGRYGAGDGKENMFRLWLNAEDAGPSSTLQKYEASEAHQEVWEHTLAVFDSVLRE